MFGVSVHESFQTLHMREDGCEEIAHRVIGEGSAVDFQETLDDSFFPPRNEYRLTVFLLNLANSLGASRSAAQQIEQLRVDAVDFIPKGADLAFIFLVDGKPPPPPCVGYYVARALSHHFRRQLAI